MFERMGSIGGGRTMKYYPKFDERLNAHLEGQRMQQAKTRLGTVMSYDKITNTVMIILDDKFANTARKRLSGYTVSIYSGRANGSSNYRISMCNRF